MAKDYTVVIAGRQYALRYTLDSRTEIEEKLGKGLFEAMFSGELKAHATIVAAGLRHADKNITPPKVVVLFQKHQDGEPDGAYDDIVKVAYRAIFESKLLGQVKDEAEMRKLIGITEDGEGKDQPAAS